MKVVLDSEACIGCGLCVHICPEVFEMEFERAQVITHEVHSRIEDVVKDAAADCPSSAISFTDDDDRPKVEERPKRWRF